jgi:hypothetical protein
VNFGITHVDKHTGSPVNITNYGIIVKSQSTDSNHEDVDDQIQQTQSGVKNQSQSQATRNKRQRQTEEKELESRKRAKEILENARQQRREARKLVKEFQSANRRGLNGSVKLRKTLEEEPDETTESTNTSTIVTNHDSLGPSIVITADDDEDTTSLPPPPPAVLPLKTSVPEVKVSSSSPDNKRIDIIAKEPFQKTKGGFPMIHHVIKNGDQIIVQYDKMPGNSNDRVISVPKNANVGFVMIPYRKDGNDGRLIAQDLHTKEIYWEGPANASYGILSNRANMNGNTGVIFNMF